MKNWTLAELYPPEGNPHLDAVVREVLSGDLSAERRVILRRALSPAERMLANERLKELTPWTIKARRPVDAIGEIVVAMFSCFPDYDGEEATAARANQYVEMLADLPPWAVKRACDALAQGTATPDDVGEKSLPKSRAPSSAVVHRLAAKILQPIYHEYSRLGSALRGVVLVDRTKSEADKARVRAKLEEYRGRPLPRSVVIEEAEAEDRLRSTSQLLAAGNERLVRRGFEQAGLEPIAGVTLGLMERLGHRVEHGAEGEPFLTAPPKLAPPPEPPKPPRRARGER